MNTSTSNTTSTLSLVDQLEELDWYFQDIFDQFRNMYELFDNINHLVEEYPLEFLLFEIQQLTSFLQRHWNASYQTLPVKIICLLSTCLLLRDIRSPREGWPPNTSCSPPSSKRTSIQCSLSSLSYYLFSLEQTLRELQDTCEYIFNDFITPEVVHLYNLF